MDGTVKGWNEGDHLARAENETFFGQDRIEPPDLAHGKQGSDPP
jgi:hypothetical protein